MVKVVAQEEEGFAIVFCQSIDEAVSKIQASLVAAFAVTIEGLPRQQGLHSIYRNDLARAMVAQSEQAFLAIAQSSGSMEGTVKILEYKEMEPFFVKGDGTAECR